MLFDRQGARLTQLAFAHGDSNNEKPLCSRFLVRVLRTGVVIGCLFLRRHACPSNRQGHGVSRQRVPCDWHVVHWRGGVGVVSKSTGEEKTARTRQDRSEEHTSELQSH